MEEGLSNADSVKSADEIKEHSVSGAAVRASNVYSETGQVRGILLPTFGGVVCRAAAATSDNEGKCNCVPSMLKSGDQGGGDVIKPAPAATVEFFPTKVLTEHFL
jgi:hypothetical protein